MVCAVENADGSRLAEIGQLGHTKPMDDTPIYKALAPDDWDAARRTGKVEAPVDRADGFVHFSTAQQLAETLERHFSGADPIWLLRYGPEHFGSALRWEPSRGGALFPHIYGPVSIDDAERIWRVARGDAGDLHLPGDL